MINYKLWMDYIMWTIYSLRLSRWEYETYIPMRGDWVHCVNIITISKDNNYCCNIFEDMKWIDDNESIDFKYVIREQLYVEFNICW